MMDSHKLFWHPERVSQWVRGEKIAPLYLDMGITRSCNISCSYCYYSVPENRSSDIIETPALVSFLQEAADIGVKAIGFLGDGEPMLHPGVYEAVVAGKDSGLDMAVATNGVLMQEEGLEEFLAALSWLRFNVSAGTPATYSNVMGVDPRIFQRVLGNIGRCVAIKRSKGLSLTIGIQMVLIPECLADIVPFAAMGRCLGVDYAVVKQCAERADDGRSLTAADYEKNRHLLQEAEALSTDDYRVIIKWGKIEGGGVKRYDRCYGPEFLPQISGNGDLYCCGAFFGNPEFLIGNINHNSFRELVSGERYAAVMRRVRERVDVHHDCGNNCRQNEINEYLWKLRNPPEHINFI
jgi:radical SAM protein with 4Fe4S-binding SPASM domain